MKKILLEILYWTWCLPQTLLGFFVKLFLNGKKAKYIINDKTYIVYNTNKTWLGGISLGKYVCLGINQDREKLQKHITSDVKDL